MNRSAEGAIATKFPFAYERAAYRRYNPDLAALSDADLDAHYQIFGEREGRRSNELASRTDFAALVPDAEDALEIGPFSNPLLRGKNAKFFDVLPREELIERAKLHGLPPQNIPAIHFVSRDGDLAAVTETFDYVLTSHSLEHQPDLVTHFKTVASLLRTGGHYLLLVPDKRYCFDHFIAESTVADVLEAFEQRRRTHTLKSVIEHRVLTTHNDCLRHWAGDHGPYLDACAARTGAALAEYAATKGSYLDVHAWYFTPQSVRPILDTLRVLGLIDFNVERLYPTRRDANEFWLILQKMT